MLPKDYLERVVKEALRTAGNDPEALPERVPQSGISLEDAPPVIHALWNAALCDIESNLLETEDGQYFFRGGEDCGLHLSTRDISFACILGLHRLLPEYVYSALKLSREARLALGWRVCASEVVDKIRAPWQPEDLDQAAFIEEYDTDSIMQNTDDVAWIWAAYELFTQGGMEATEADWRWLYDSGLAFFETFYSTFYDPVDELYQGQAAGISVHTPGQASDGYPPHWGFADCIRSRSTATNALYVKAFHVMAEAGEHCGEGSDASAWHKLGDQLKESVRVKLRNENRTLAYYRDSEGKLTLRRHALGDALAVLHGVVEDQAANDLLAAFPYDKVGVRLLHPAFNSDSTVFNNTAWPHVSTFFFSAREQLKGTPEINANAAAIARSYANGTFHERIDYRNGKPLGSAQHLCTAVSWMNLCLRAGFTPC